MVATYAQKQASKRYRDKQAAQGVKQHIIFCDALHWQIIKPIAQFCSKMSVDGLRTIEIDDNGEYIKFIYDKTPTDDTTEENQSKDDR